MADTKQDVLDMLRELSELTMLEEGDPQSFRVRAYESAAQAIAAQATDLGRMTKKELQQIEGIGKSTAEKIRELLDTGKVEKLEGLRRKHPRSVVDLLRIQGLGPKALMKLRSELGVQSIDDLRAALAEHKVRALKSFGPKSEEKLTQALARLDAEGAAGRTPISVALPLATRIVERLRELPRVSHAAYSGSLRRFKETVGDVDIVVAASAAEPVMEALVSMSVVDRVLVRGEAKTSVVTRRGTQVDLRVVAEHQLGAALLYFTGSKGHNIKLRQRALARGYTLNEYALSEIEGGRVVASESEEQIYAALGLPFIPAEIRNGADEIQAAVDGSLPLLLARSDIRGDLHMHTSFSDGRDSVEDMVEMCRSLGYEYMAITDHSPHSAASRNLSADTIAKQADEIARLREKYPDIAILHGCEVDILPDSRLDFPDRILERLDIVLASLHERAGHSPERLLHRYESAMKHPLVTLITHPTNRMVPNKPGYDLDYDRFFAMAVETGTLVEIDGSPAHLDLDGPLARRAVAAGATLAVDSDCHRAELLDIQMELGVRTGRRGWVERRHVLNTRPLADIRAAVAAKRKG